MGTTPTHQIPYPEPGDLLASYPTNTGKPLADRVDALLTSVIATVPKPFASGSLSFNFDGTTTTPTAVAVTFPVGRFATTPAVVIGSNSRTAIACAASVNASGFSLGPFWLTNPAVSSVTYMWIAQEKG